MTILTVVAGAGVGWLYYHRITFKEPLFFLMEIFVNLPLIFAFSLFLVLLFYTVSLWIKR
jgi:hypothetical protein